MHPRKAKHLADIKSDRELFATVSAGIGLCAANARSLFDQAQVLAVSQVQRQGCEILNTFAKEEAGKALILLDAVRCPRATLEKHLKGKFYHHLARLLYGEACDFHFDDYGSFIKHLNLERQEFYLDGPNDVDWIFRNRATQDRESLLYVDYVENVDGVREWVSPAEHCHARNIPVIGPDLLVSGCLSLVETLARTGLTSPGSLAIIAKKWRPVVMHDAYRWPDLHDLAFATMAEAESLGLAKVATDEANFIVDKWQFPLHQADLGLIEGGIENLREIQKSACAPWD